MMTPHRVLRHLPLDLQVLRVLQAHQTHLHTILEKVLPIIQVPWSELSICSSDVTPSLLRNNYVIIVTVSY